MTETLAGTVVDMDGLRGSIVQNLQQTGDDGVHLIIEMTDGHRFWAPQEWLEEKSTGEYYLPFRASNLPAAPVSENGSLVIPVIEETLRVGRRKVTTGGVRITKRVHTEDGMVKPMRARETVEVERVPINREVAEPPPVRQEGDTTIVPILEEVLVVEKRLMLREEVRITRHRQEIVERYRAVLRKEEAQVERLDGGDQTVSEDTKEA